MSWNPGTYRQSRVVVLYLTPALGGEGREGRGGPGLVRPESKVKEVGSRGRH